MPLVLVVLALGIGAIAFVIREQTHAETVTIRSKPAGSQVHSGGAVADGTKLVTEKETETVKATSDTTFATLLGLAALLLILGAFYARVSKITVAGNSVELGAATQDAPAVADVVAKQAEQKVLDKASDGKLTIEEAMSIARTVAKAAAGGQAEAARLRLAGVAGTQAGSPLATEHLRALGRGAPLPDSVLKRIAATVMDEPGV